MRISDWSSDVCSSDLAASQLRQAWLNLQRSSIVAPVSGYVAQRQVQLGQRVQPGTTLMTIVPLEQMWVEANFKETQLTKMHIGQPVEVHADLYGGDVTYDGTIASLGMGTGSAFSLLPAQNASGNWIKLVQDRKSEERRGGKGVYGRVDTGGSRRIKKKKK